MDVEFASLETNEEGTAVSIYVRVPAQPERTRLWTRFGAEDWAILHRARGGMLLCPQYYPPVIFDALRAA